MNTQVFLVVIGGLMSLIGVVGVFALGTLRSTFENKIDELMTLYSMTFEELKDIKALVIRHDEKLNGHEKELKLHTKKIDTILQK